MLAIVIPIIILSIAAGIFVFTSSTKYDFSSVSTESYDVINQIQWSQTVSNMIFTLTGKDSEEEKLQAIKETAKGLEDFGSIIYIEKDGAVYYSSVAPEEALKTAASISKIDKNKNSYYYGDEGLVIVNSVKSESGDFTVIAANDTYSSPDSGTNYAPQHIMQRLANNATAVLGVCVATFIAAIIILSLLTSKTIIGLWKK